MLILEKIMNESIWIANMNGYRMTGTYAELKGYKEDPECRDFDLCAEQPEHLKDFYNKYFEYDGFITVQDFYNQHYKPQRRVWTEDEIRILVQTNDKVLYGALRKLYACQTDDEKSDGTASHRNGSGFNGIDAGILTSFVKFLDRAGFLTVRQKEIARKKMIKYTRQLTMLANV